MIGGSMRNFLIVLITLVFGIISDVALAKEDFCIGLNNSSYMNPVQFSPGSGSDVNYILEPRQTVTFSRKDMETACPYGPNSCYVEISSPGENNYEVIYGLPKGARITYQGFYDNHHYYYIDRTANIPCVSK
jgi:hypothetical protein